MCEECYYTYCPESCPNFEGGNEPLGRCEKCGSYIYDGEVHIESDGKLYCCDCTEAFDTDSILRVCDMSDVFELLRELGVATVS